MKAVTSFFILLLVVLTFSCSGEKLVSSHNKDITPTDTLLEYYKDSVYTPSQSMINTLTEAALSVKDSVSKCKINITLALIHYYNQEFDQAIRLAKDAVEISTPSKKVAATPELIKLNIKACNTLAVLYSQIDKRDSASIYLKQAISQATKAKDNKQLTTLYINLADNDQALGDVTHASAHYRQALKICDSVGGMESDKYAILSGIAKLYMDIDNFEMADNYFKMAEKIEEGRTPHERYYFSNSRGTYYYNIKKYRKALKHFFKAHDIVKSNQSPFDLAISEANIGETYIYLSIPDSARIYLDHSKELFEESYMTESTKFYINGLYASLALLENDMALAKKLLSSTVVPADNPQYTYYHNQRLMKYYLRCGDSKRANDFYELTTIYEDSLQNYKLKNSILEAQYRYEQDTIILRKNIELAEGRAESEHWKLVVLLLIMVIFIVVIISIFVSMKRQRNHRDSYRRQVEIISTLRREIICNRLTPHYIYNVINVILPAFSPYQDIHEPLIRLVKVIRESLLFGEHMSIPIYKERQWLEDYIALRLLGLNIPINVEWKISSEIDTNILIPSMAIQIPVGNALKHAFHSIDVDDPTVTISISQDKKDQLLISIEDNGRGYYPEKRDNNSGTGSGIKILEHTIEVLNSSNRNKITLSINNLRDLDPTKSGTVVKIVIPSNFNFQA